PFYRKQDLRVREASMKIFALGLGPILAVSTAVPGGLLIGLSMAITLALSVYLVSIVRKRLPKVTQNALSVLIIAFIVTLITLAAGYLAPGLSASLGIYLPVIAVNCFIYISAGIYTLDDAPPVSILWAGFCLILTSGAAGFIRELAGNGTATLMLNGFGFVLDLGKNI